ncbi:hypothetical protein HN51_001156 [Arachis hypogaea]|nr:uncharacterized protein DS421_1g11970 [Arachis hypogaea]
MKCTKPHCFFKQTTAARKVKDSSWWSCTWKKVDGGGGCGVAVWLCQSVSAAFFATLEWCACMYVDTWDGPPAGHDHSDNNHAPLILIDKKEHYSSGTQILKHN